METDNKDVAEKVLNKAYSLSKKPDRSLTMMAEGFYTANDPTYVKNFIESAKKIIGAQKFSYDETVVDLVEHISAIDLEEILANFDKISFPFDRLWLTGFDPHLPKIQVGYMIEADNENHSFKFHRFVDAVTTAVASKVIVTVDKDGIKFDEDHLLGQLSAIHESVKTRPDLFADFQNKEDQELLQNMIVGEIDKLYQSVDFLARLFVLHSANKRPLPSTSPDELAREIASNRSRQRMGRPLKPMTVPLRLDLSFEKTTRKKATVKELRVLLGWTSVKRSKPIVSKYGVVFTRKPHDRRIPAPEDRRNRGYELIASNPEMSLSFGPTRPLLEPAVAKPSELKGDK